MDNNKNRRPNRIVNDDVFAAEYTPTTLLFGTFKCLTFAVII